MSVGGDPVSTPNGVVERAKAILTTPKTEWPVIAAEPATPQSIYIPYVLMLAAIGPIASAIGMSVFGFRFMGVVITANPAAMATQAIVSYVMSLISVFILSLVIDALAPTFNGTKDKTAALKVAAYAMTPAWIAGIFGLYPPLSGLALLGALYALYLLYLGLPILMKAPADKAIAYVAVTIVSAIVVYFVLALVTAPIIALTSPMSMTGGYPAL